MRARAVFEGAARPARAAAVFAAAVLAASCATGRAAVPARGVSDAGVRPPVKACKIVVTGAFPTVDWDAALNAALDGRCRALFWEFEEEIQKYEKAAGEEGAAGREFEFCIAAREGRNTEQVYSLLLSVEWNAGGAHGEKRLESFLWDKKEHEMLSVKYAMALAGIPSLEALSQRCASELERAINAGKDAALAEMIAEGTEAEAENFGVFLAEDSQVTFYFPPYQVAPGVMGTQQVSFPVQR